MNLRRVAAIALPALVACSSAEPEQTFDPGLEDLAIESVQPAVVVPGSRIAIAGEGFVPEDWGDSRLRLVGTLDGAPIDVELTATFADYERMEVDLAPAAFDQLGGEGAFSGRAILEVDSAVDGATHESVALSLDLEVRRALTPSIATMQSEGLIFVNDELALEGDGLLLGGGEGETIAIVSGCFTPLGAADCVPVAGAEVPLRPDGPFDRRRASFRFAPAIAGIQPGGFSGQVTLENRASTGATTASGEATVSYEVTEPVVFSLNPTAASLGQYVDVEGGGFVGLDDGGATLIQLEGTFAPDGGAPVPVTLEMVPEYVSGRLVRYIVNEDDRLGQAVDLRRVTGTFNGTVRPVVQFADDEVTGAAVQTTLAIAPVKQVVHLVFRPSFVESLRHFGLRAVDRHIRARVAEVVARDYATVNLEVRLEAPADFALYAGVELNGKDLNDQGLLGYDNTPGKDTGNKRLFDLLGGVNASTQSDGFPGFGGVFIESLFAFSRHPGSFAASVEGQASSLFDEIFDPFRPDRGGQQVTSADVGELPTVAASDCPATDRPRQVACAVRVLGNLIGTTLSHEIGHSLGLANPFGDGFHNPSDEPNRLMDSGGARTFNERAELAGEGPAVFCTTEYEYLREILPTAEPADPTPRPTCF